MHNKMNQHLFAYILCSAMILALVMYFETATHNYVQASPHTTASALNRQTVILPAQAYFTQQMNTPITNTAIVEPKKVIANQKAKTDKFETTAFYLNVRANAYGTSKIINVVKKGTILEVESITKNGWLKLHGGGYVHGGYAKLIAETTAKAENEVKTLSASVTSTEKIATPATVDLAVIEQPPSEPVKPSSAVNSDSGLTEEHIAEIFAGTPLADHDLEQAILEVEDEYGINAYFTIAVMKLESGNGSSRLAKKKNNLFGLNAIDGDAFNRAFSFPTKGDSVRKFGELIADKYVNKGYVTVDKVARKYCPANPKWSGMVKSIMNEDYKKV